MLEICDMNRLQGLMHYLNSNVGIADTADGSDIIAYVTLYDSNGNNHGTIQLINGTYRYIPLTEENS